MHEFVLHRSGVARGLQTAGRRVQKNTVAHQQSREAADRLERGLGVLEYTFGKCFAGFNDGQRLRVDKNAGTGAEAVFAARLAGRARKDELQSKDMHACVVRVVRTAGVCVGRV